MKRNGEMMARPKPDILLDITDKKTFMTEQVLKADGTYLVYYDGKPFNLRSKNFATDWPGPKYKKIAFTSSSPAFNLADRLNKMFNTNKFQVMKVKDVEPISRDCR